MNRQTKPENVDQVISLRDPPRQSRSSNQQSRSGGGSSSSNNRAAKTEDLAYTTKMTTKPT
ncbi:uncharacterized protein DS421_3g104400 [Arachis hypogaea]|nr:uncharacterized protein DS421_3g104400 [Arachis hypogaea]